MREEICDGIYNKLVRELHEKYNIPQDDEGALVDLYYLVNNKREFFHGDRKRRIVEKVGLDKFESILNDYKEIEDIINITREELKGN